jgi:hypothetical protein
VAPRTVARHRVPVRWASAPAACTGGRQVCPVCDRLNVGFVGIIQCLVYPLCVPFPDSESNVLFPNGRCGKVNGGFGGFMTCLISTSAASWQPSDDSGPYC